MKLRIFIVLSCVIILLLSACVKIGEETKAPNTDYLSSLEALEGKLDLLLAEQKKVSNENKIEFEELRSEIEELKKESEAATESEKVTEPLYTSPKFLYELKDGRAVITGYTGDDTYIVIPSHIDGYEVESVGESAFSSSKITTVIISEGVKKIDWFAFYTCPHLTSVTLPRSVTSIGYAAFEGASSSFSIYCYANSYAYDYAKSYAIPYVAV